MTQNLRIAGTTITSEDSNVFDSYIIPYSNISAFNSNTNYNQEAAYIDNTYGGYYTWQTATAGTGSSVSNGESKSSICPKGWRLPTGGASSGEFYTLNSAYGGATNTDKHLLDSPGPNFQYGGNLYIDTRSGGYKSNQNSFRYWSGTGSSSGQKAYTMDGYSTNIHFNVEWYRYYGNQVRCLAS